MGRQEASVCQHSSIADSSSDGSTSEDEFSETQQRKRQRQHVIDLAVKLAAGDSVDDRQGLMQQLMDVTMQYTQRISSNTLPPALSKHKHAAESLGSTRADEPRQLDLEQSLDELFSDSCFSSDSSECGDEPSERGSSSDCEDHGNKLMISLEGGDRCIGNLEEVSIEAMFGSEVRLTQDGAEAMTPCAKARTASDFAVQPTSEDGESWLALYNPEIQPNSPVAETDEQHVLLPVLTPSNTKLCAALLDAFLPLR